MLQMASAMWVGLNQAAWGGGGGVAAAPHAL